MFSVWNEVTYKLRHNVINFDKTRFQVEVWDGLDDGSFDESTSLDVGRLVEESGCSPIWAM